MDREVIIKGMMFAAGALIGSAVTWKLLKTKYEQIAQEEIESVKEAFGAVKKQEDDVETVESDTERVNRELEEIIDGYVSHNDERPEKKEEEKDMGEDRPYVISPDDFGDCDYTLVSFTYYLDGVVTNEQDKIVGNVDELIGEESLEHFGEYEDDSVFVRNDKLQMDFEILKDYREYYEEIMNENKE